MPAIHPARLSQESARLAALTGDPPAYRRALEDLLDTYADRVLRQGQTGTPAPIMVTYNAPGPVMRQILAETLAAVTEEQTLPLADHLWERPALECRIVAAHLLGRANPAPAEEITRRLKSWAESCEEIRLFEALFQFGTVRLRAQAFPALANLIGDWLDARRFAQQRLGLLALGSLVKAEDFDNLPYVFRSLGPFCRKPAPEAHSHLRAVLMLLGKRSPLETAYFLRQSFNAAHDAGAAWLARQTAPVLPAEQQAALREALKT